MVHQPRLIVSTVGASLLYNHVLPQDGSAARELLISVANAAELTIDEEAFIAQIIERAKQTLATNNVQSIRGRSAELNGIYAIYEGQIRQGQRDVHVLIATDTELGRRCAGLVEQHLQAAGITTLVTIPAKLTAANSAAFEAGSKELIYWCAETIPAYRSQGYAVIFNLVAAFKALQAYLNTIGMFYADQILYLFEGKTATPVWIPRLPIRIDLGVLKPYAVFLALMAEASAVVPSTLLGDLSPALYDHDEAGDAMISQWGLLIWQQVRDELLGTELLPFPALRYGAGFQRDFRSAASNTERVRLQSVLARVSAVLFVSGGDVASLKVPGSGIHYDNYTGNSTVVF